MGRIAWHVVRATLVFAWLYLGYADDQQISLTMGTALLCAGVYDIVLASCKGIDSKTRLRIAVAGLLIILVLMLGERHPWDDLPGYMALCLYLPELALNLRTLHQKLIVIPSIVPIVILVALLSLYRIGWLTSPSTASINGHPAPCRITRMLGTADMIVDTGSNVFVVNVREDLVKDVPAHRSMPLGRLQFVDMRYRGGHIVAAGEFDTGWDPKLSYRNGTLSFYADEDELLVCKGVKLK